MFFGLHSIVNLENPIVRMLIESERQLSLQIAEKEEAEMQKPVLVSTGG